MEKSNYPLLTQIGAKELSDYYSLPSIQIVTKQDSDSTSIFVSHEEYVEQNKKFEEKDKQHRFNKRLFKKSSMSVDN